MNTRATIRDVAKVAGVSTATVSRFVNESGYVNDITATRIQNAILKTGYIPSHMARSLKTQRSGMLLLLVPDVCNPFYSAIAQTIQRLADKDDYVSLLVDSEGNPERELKAINMARQMSVEGVLYASIDINPQANKSLADAPFHTVGLNAFAEDTPFDVVVVDPHGGTNLAIDILADAGHRQIAFIGGTPGSFIGDSRKNGFLFEMEHRGLPVKPDWILEIGFSQQDGFEAGRALLAARELPTAICCANDLIALGVMHALYDTGLRVPEDISITGMDNISYGMLANPPLTTITNDPVEFARCGYSMLHERLCGSTVQPRREIIPNTLVQRSSVSSPRDALG